MWKEKLNQSREQLSQLLSSFDWQQAREKITQESRARIVLLGLPEAGKSTLFNHMCGWDVSMPPLETVVDTAAAEDYGLFCLIDLPPQPEGAETYPLNGGPGGYNGFMSDLYPPLYGLGAEVDPLEMAEGADLLLYVLDGPQGVRPPDYRWVGRLRRLGVPLLVLLNKCDQLNDDLERRQSQAEARLGTAVLPVSALTGSNVADHLLPKMVNLCPELAVALGRELRLFRRQAARRLIHRAAVLNGLVALEPLPLLDLPVQLMTLTGLMMRLGAIYDHNANRARRREIGLALVGGLAGRYGAQQLAKLVPVVGWVVSGAIGWSCTWALGEAAMAYFEAGGDAAVDRRWQKTRGRVTTLRQAVSCRWQQRPRLKRLWGRRKDVADDSAEVAHE